MNIHKIIFHRFTPSHGSPHVISHIIKHKFDEPWPSWKKVRLEVRDLWFEEFKVIYTFGSISIALFINFSILLNYFLMEKHYSWDSSQEKSMRQKGSLIFKNAMSKIRNGHDHATWILHNVQTILDEHWGSTDFQNKSSTTKANRTIDKGALAYCGGSISTSAYYEKMAIKLQRSSNAWEVIEKTKN
ncbi:hypothetical protein CR513_01374, partial [Mucuna pruriens]